MNQHLTTIDIRSRRPRQTSHADEVLTDFARRMGDTPERTFTVEQLRTTLTLSARLTFRLGALQAEATRIRQETGPRRTLADWFPLSQQAKEAQDFVDYAWDEAHAAATAAFDLIVDSAAPIVTAADLIARIRVVAAEAVAA
ncbi:hypothetical protein [Streptomyces sp. NPDC048611]|uniref:hypothetical protein n=1 Tax=Streptomyces sp. NPDC048611 TaxID=3155635 RepID=UPI0034160764